MSGSERDPAGVALAEIAGLRDRLRRLEDEREIGLVLASYGPGLDDGDEKGWADCFTDDGVWETTGPGMRRRHHREGREELLEFARQHTRSPEHLHKHCVFGSRIGVDGDAAVAVSYFVRLDALPDGPVVVAFGRYHDRLEHVSGVWKIAHRRCEIQSTGPRQA